MGGVLFLAFALCVFCGEDLLIILLYTVYWTGGWVGR